MAAKKRVPQVHLYHATAPTCWWSWGYEAVLNRLALVYGDRVKVHLLLGCVYEDLDEWRRAYEMTESGQVRWARESAKIMGVPLRTDYGGDQPRSVMPATLAVLAANRQGRGKGARFMRSVLRRFCVEGQDVTRDEVLEEAAKEAGLRLDAFFRDYRDTDARRAELEHQGHGFPHVPLGFYNLALTDGGDRMVVLDYAFDPTVVEAAIDFLAGAGVPRQRPGDLVDYLRRHGPAPLRELARVLGRTDSDVTRALGRLAKQGRVEPIRIGGAAHWQATRAGVG